ncbi:MAG: phosphate ABC transporter substrate-binding protein PstS [Deltaproteobacteria bacterium]|nr:phosphate ABC transporter substrate-binding protein PstS [Deltaproteobacteria bacterium]
MRKILGLLAVALLAAVSFSACSEKPLLINGAGATFPYPLYSKWFHEYHKLHPKLRFNYQSIGSGGGIKQIAERTVDFGASDAPISDAQLAKLDWKLLHIPAVLGTVVLSYNLPEVGDDLKLTGPVVADIFLGKLKKWNDPRLAALNPEKKLPEKSILVAHRSDGSGTTYVFTDYLSKVSPEWKQKVGREKAVNWPAGLGGKGNEGVTGLVKQTHGSIGYIELGYAVPNKLPTALIQNRAGQFIKPTIASTTAAAEGVAGNMPKDYRVSITDAPGAQSYPISAFTYLLIYQTQENAAKGKALVQFLRWATKEGQKLAPILHYAPLPDSLTAKIEATISTIKVAK